MADLDSFRAARWLRTLNLVLQAGLFLTFVLGLNYLARNHAWRYDLTQHRRYSLSPETLSYVQHLSQPVTIVVTFTDENDNPEVRGLLEEFKNASESRATGRITVKYLDPYQDRRKAEELGIEQPDVIMFLCGDRRRARPIDELYRIKNQKRDAFIGEQAITEALLDVSSPDRQHIYFLVGHAELRPDEVDPARGLSALRDQLRIRNFAVDTLDLSIARKIPTDASLLVATAPQSRYSAAEQELLRQYLGPSAGRLLLFLAPGISANNLGLDELLLDWGILVDDDVIYDTGADNITDDGDMIIKFLDGKHAITQTLIDNNVALRIGAARSVRPDPGRSPGSGLNVTTLAATSVTAWGEVSYRAMPHFDAGVDIRPIPGIEPKDRLGVAVASERTTVRDNLPFSVRGGRLVVFGTGDLAANARIANAGNQFLFLSAVNWTVDDRNHQLNVPPRPIERFTLSLSAGELLKLRYTLLFALPGAAALLGLAVYWTRRS